MAVAALGGRWNVFCRLALSDRPIVANVALTRRATKNLVDVTLLARNKIVLPKQREARRRVIEIFR